MRRALALLALTTALFVGATLSCPPLAAQRRPSPTPFPDADEGLTPSRARAFTINGSVSDAETNARLDGVRVDLQALSGGTLASAFTSANGSFEFVNVRAGTYQLIFEEVGYQEVRQDLELEGPVFAMNVSLRRLYGGEPGGPPIVSVRELSIPRKAHDAMNKGMSLLYQKSDYPGSIKQFQRAIHAYPNYYEAYAHMGVAYMKMKDVDSSEQALRKSVEISQGRYSDGLFLLASLLSSTKRFADAEPLARRAVEVDPNSWHAQSELAQALVRLDRPDAAEPYAQAAVKLQPENPILRLLLADIHIELRNDPALLDDLNSYLKLAPNGTFAPQVRQHRDEVQQRLQNSKASPADSPSDTRVNP